MAFEYRSAFFLGDYIRESLFLGGLSQSPNHDNTPGGKVYLSLFGNDSDQPPATDDEWYALELSGGDYARRPSFLAYDSTNRRVYANNFSFPTASGDWGTAYWYGIYNASSGSSGLFYVGKFFDPSNPHTVLSSGLNITDSDTLNFPDGISIHTCNYEYDDGGGAIPTWYTAPTGLTGLEYSGYLARWIFNFDTDLSDAGGTIDREYDLAIGRYTGDWRDIMDEYGRLTDWIECSGQGYQRQRLTTSDWITYEDLNGGEGAPYSYSSVYNKYTIPFTSYAQSDWGNINMWALYPTNRSDLVSFWGTFSTAVNVTQGMSYGVYENDLCIHCLY